MSIEKKAEETWLRLNEYENASTARANERADRDLPDGPWTEEDSEKSMRRMVQEMTGRLARVEERLNVIYYIGHGTLKAFNQLTFVAIAAAVALLVASVWRA